MRTEAEMYELILNIARRDERIRGVYMNGSRTNPDVPRDIFQDYDIVYVVTEMSSFVQDKTWFQQFGEILFMQLPDETPEGPDEYAAENFYGWLMQFRDGSRIDLHAESISHARENILKDKLCRILLDKDKLFPPIPEATDEDYHVKRPTEKEYLCACNEVWWCLDNVAKGLWRKELPYVQDMLNFHIRKQLELLLSWKAGLAANFSVSVGKSGKYLYRFLTESEWADYLATYSSARVEDCWRAVFKMCDLFEKTAVFVGAWLGYEYNNQEGQNCRRFLEHVQALPENAEDFGDLSSKNELKMGKLKKSILYKPPFRWCILSRKRNNHPQSG